MKNGSDFSLLINLEKNSAPTKKRKGDVVLFDSFVRVSSFDPTFHSSSGGVNNQMPGIVRNKILL
jgi:hypothetical protein